MSGCQSGRWHDEDDNRIACRSVCLRCTLTRPVQCPASSRRRAAMDISVRRRNSSEAVCTRLLHTVRYQYATEYSHSAVFNVAVRRESRVYSETGAEFDGHHSTNFIISQRKGISNSASDDDVFALWHAKLSPTLVLHLLLQSETSGVKISMSVESFQPSLVTKQHMHNSGRSILHCCWSHHTCGIIYHFISVTLNYRFSSFAGYWKRICLAKDRGA